MITHNNPKLAVLGCGYWGKNLVRNFHQLGVLALVCDPSEAGRKQAREFAPDVDTTDDFEKVFSRDDIAGVAIATPAETHCPLALRAMEEGKDVFVEKPLALTYHEGVRMEKKAREKDCVLMVGHLLEYHPAVIQLREMVNDDTLGPVNYIYSHRLNFGKVRTEENALWSFAPHDVAVILRLVGELPFEVTCTGGSYITLNLPDVTVSCLHFRNGLRAHVFVSWLNPFKEQKLVVVGKRRMAVFNDVAEENKLNLFDQRVQIRDSLPRLWQGDSVSVDYPNEEPLRNECLHFIDCVRMHKQPFTGAQSGIDVLQVLQACQTSLELGGKPTRLSEQERQPILPLSMAAAG